MPDSPHSAKTEPLAAAGEKPQAPPAAGASIKRVAHHGWAGSWLISNGIVEVIVVPQIGRVMQFRLLGDADGTFWENRALDGRQHPAAPGQWLNFGGDKCWPSPQSSWTLHQDHDWPPPHALDGLPMQACLAAETLVLTSTVDAVWGIQVVRHIRLLPNQPVLHIRTEYRKLAGPPIRTGVWTITQFQEPEQICVLLASPSKLKSGYISLLDAPPAALQIHDLGIERKVLSLQRHRNAYTKIGADGASLAWIGRTCVVRMDVVPRPGEYPDGGCLTDVYTNPDPLQYVELETLGPLHLMAPGDCIHQNVRYTIFRRTEVECATQVRTIFAACRG